MKPNAKKTKKYVSRRSVLKLIQSVLLLSCSGIAYGDILRTARRRNDVQVEFEPEGLG